MKFVSFTYDDLSSIGVLNSSEIIDIHLLSDKEIPDNMLEYLENFEFNNNKLKKLLSTKVISKDICYNINDVFLNAPLPNPPSFRDAYAFRKHVEAGRKNRGLDMIPEYDDFPVFYFSNHHSITGPGNVYVQNQYFKKLDFEFEIGAVISKRGKNIKSSDAINYIAGFMILNDWSERDVQLKEMKLNLGPAKGKDFATSVGPWLVTLDELEDAKVIQDDGPRFDLNMRGYINENLVSEDNFKNMTWSFSDIIERASSGVELYPGDIIGSGTCSTGCLLELNLTNKNEYWLKEGDVIKLEVENLGILSNTICLNK